LSGYSDRLVASFPAGITKINNLGRTPLHVAAEKRESGAAMLLLKALDSIDSDTIDNAPIGLETSPLDRRLSSSKASNKVIEGRFKDHLTNVKGLKSTKILRGFINQADHENYTAIYLASQSGCQKIVENLLYLGAEIDSRSKDGTTPLWEAAQMGYSSIIRVLLKQKKTYSLPLQDSGRDKIDGHNALSIAALWGHTEAVAILLDTKIDKISQTNDGNTPLHEALKYKHATLIPVWIEKGAFNDICNNMGTHASALRS
jgi:ankyrin repeat protein